MPTPKLNTKLGPSNVVPTVKSERRSGSRRKGTHEWLSSDNADRYVRSMVHKWQDRSYPVTRGHGYCVTRVKL
jgi:hypothetical protein